LDQQYGREVDFWTLGVLIYQMQFQQSPFRGDDEDEIYDAILGDDPLFPFDTPQETVSILQKLLTREHTQRLGAGSTGVDAVMEHPYFADINWDDLYNKRVQPPFVPADVGGTDTSYFDYEFTSLPKVFTPVTSGMS
jgi:serine/threonine protein kinase